MNQPATNSMGRTSSRVIDVSEKTSPDGHLNRSAGSENFAAIGEKLLKICSPTLDHVGRFTQHSSRLMDLWSQLGANPKLQILHKDFEDLLAVKWPDDASSESFRRHIASAAKCFS